MKTYKIESYSGYFYVTSLKTGKTLINRSFKTHQDAKMEANKYLFTDL